MTEILTVLEAFEGRADDVGEIAFAIVTIASIITALTPTPRDDQMLGKIYKLIELLALNIGRAKEKAPNLTGGRFVPD